MRLVHYSGAGNTFFLADNREKHWNIGQLFPHIEGVDGLIVADPGTDCDAYMRIINKDGSQAQMCGRPPLLDRFS